MRRFSHKFIVCPIFSPAIWQVYQGTVSAVAQSRSGQGPRQAIAADTKREPGMGIQLDDRQMQGGGQSMTQSLWPREQLKLWLREVMKTKNWSAEKWAKAANVSGTTITRFLNTEDPNRVLTQRTVEKLAQAADIPSPHEQRQVFIALIRRQQLIEEARRKAPLPLDLFSMPYLETVPAPEGFADCRLGQLDNGKFAICRQTELAGLKPGNRLMVLRDCMTERASLSCYLYDPPMLVPAEPSPPDGSWVSSLPMVGPHHQILGKMVGIFTLFDD